MRVNDVAGLEGFGPLEIADDEPQFHADWEAHVLAIKRALLRRGVYTLEEFRDAIERTPPPDYLTTPCYERWWKAVCSLLREKCGRRVGSGSSPAGKLRRTTALTVTR